MILIFLTYSRESERSSNRMCNTCLIVFTFTKYFCNKFKYFCRTII